MRGRQTFIIFGSHFFLSFVALYDRKKPALTGSDTNKFNFPIMVLYKCPPLLGNLSPVGTASRQAMPVLLTKRFGSVQGKRELQPFGP